MRGGNALHEPADVHERLALAGLHQVWDVMEVGVERAAGKPGTFGDGRDRDAGQVARCLDLGGEGVAQMLARSDATPVCPGHGIGENPFQRASSEAVSRTR